MRILGFSKKWTKLNNPIIFTTFRFPRKDRDWEAEEIVQVVYKPRSKDREVLGIARIIRKEKKDLNKRWQYYSLKVPNTPDMITPLEAKEDGFPGYFMAGDVDDMMKFFKKTHGDWGSNSLINKLTLYWIEK